MLSKFYGKIMETAQKCWHTFRCTCTAVDCTQLLKGIILTNNSFINVEHVVFFHSLPVFGTFFDINARSFYRTQVHGWSCFCSILCYMVQCALIAMVEKAHVIWKLQFSNTRTEMLQALLVLNFTSLNITKTQKLALFP